MEMEVWHGNCSTFGLLDRHLEQLQQTNYILFGNFFTGQLDRLNLTCVRYQSTSRSTRISDMIIACLLAIVLIAMCIVACAHRRKFMK